MAPEIKILSAEGKGRAFVLLAEATGGLPEELQKILARQNRALLIELPRITEENWQDLTAALRQALGTAGVRQASYVAFGPATALAQNLCLSDLKAVRSLVLVDATTRPHPSLFLRIVDKIERALPLGLPLRSYSRGFDAKPFLHRMRCPVLVLTTAGASPYQQEEARILSEHLPTSWSAVLPAEQAAAKLTELVLEFQNVKAKCPMKNVLNA